MNFNLLGPKLLTLSLLLYNMETVNCAARLTGYDSAIFRTSSSLLAKYLNKVRNGISVT